MLWDALVQPSLVNTLYFIGTVLLLIYVTLSIEWGDTGSLTYFKNGWFCFAGVVNCK